MAWLSREVSGHGGEKRLAVAVAETEVAQHSKLAGLELLGLLAGVALWSTGDSHVEKG